jgi:signal transduction histidine kinase
VDARRRNFLDKMSHELRTPLNAIIGFSEMLRLGFVGGLSTKQGEYVTDICSSGRHLLDLVDDVLDVGRIEGGQEELSLSRFPLERVVRDSVAICREEAVRRHVSLSLRVNASLGEVTADQRKVKQILLNLVWNALKFTPAGGSVSIDVIRVGSGFEVHVTDTGPGVPPEDNERIFAEYEQAANEHGPTGTGLGLPLARRLARLHGGDLELKDPPDGSGAKFVLSLPAAASASDPGREAAVPTPLAWVGSDDPGILDEGSALEWLVGADGLGRYRARMTGIAIVIEILATGVIGTLHQPKDFRLVEWPWLGVSLGLVGLLITFHPRVRFTATQLYRLSLVAVPLTGFYVWTVGPQLSPAMSTIIMMMGVAVFTAFRWRRALLIGLVVGMSYAVVLAREPDSNLSISRWFLTMGLMASGALIARWLLQFLPPLVASEKEARRDAEIANAQLAAASSHKSEFLANMSHELRTPLNAIIGFADVLEQGFFGELNAKQLEYVEDIESAGRHLLALINDILDLAKAEAGRLELNTGPCCLPELIEAGTSAARTEASSRGVVFRVSFDGTDQAISGDPFAADPQRLARAIASVVDNAVDFTPAGGEVAVSASRSNDRVEIAVSDSGPGIHPADHERIFAAFEHAGRGDRAGSGIGLALARRLVQLHGGALSVSSRPGQGSVFTFSLPVTALGDLGDSRTDTGSEPALA